MICEHCAAKGERVDMASVKSDVPDRRKFKCDRCGSSAYSAKSHGIAVVREALKTATPKLDGYGQEEDEQ